MTATTNYQAGVETTAVQMAYIQETAWGVALTGAMKRIRFTGESLTGSKSRQRPAEINANREASAAVTTELTAGGGVNFALSYGTYDDILSGLFGGEWATNVLKPGTVFKSFLLEKRFGPALFLRYPGLFWSGATLTMARGQFLSGSFTAVAKDEADFTASASTGGTYTAPPDTAVMDSVTGVRDIMLDGVALAAVANNISLTISNDGASADYGLGAAAAQGMRMGTFTVSGSMELYFRDFALYQRYKGEIAGPISWKTLDAAGNAYRFTLPKGTLMNPSIVAGGPNQPVMARYALEGNPDATDGTLKLERIPAVVTP
jgi:hypothetical protein